MNKTVLKNLITVISPVKEIENEAMQIINNSSIVANNDNVVCEISEPIVNVLNGTSFNGKNDPSGYIQLYTAIANSIHRLSSLGVYNTHTKTEDIVISNESHVTSITDLNHSTPCSIKDMLKASYHVPVPKHLIYVAPAKIDKDVKKSYIEVIHKHTKDVCDTLHIVHEDTLKEDIQDILYIILSE